MVNSSASRIFVAADRQQRHWGSGFDQQPREPNMRNQPGSLLFPIVLVVMPVAHESRDVDHGFRP